MERQSRDPSYQAAWESVHKCPKCSYELNLEKLDLDVTTTGIATCPRCGWAGQIDLKIVPGQNSAD